jgi:tetratricopeptide (TPR) repeat protein
LTAIPEHLGDLKGQFKVFSEEAGSAVRRSDWKKACQFYGECLRILGSMENGLWTRIRTWLLLWVCIPLVHIYQVWLKNYPKCVAIYDLMLQQLNQEDTDGSEGDENLGQLYYVIVWHRRMVLFEWSHTIDRKANGDHCRRLLSLYVRAKSFNVVAVQNKEAQGFEWLQIMTNEWGRRSSMKSGEGDMRVAFCFNLQHLFGISQQCLSELVKWTREKWVWINLADVDQESKIRWKIQDVEESYLVNVLDEIAQKEIAQLEGCMLQKKIFECNILRCEAKFCIFSDPNKAEQLLLDVENKLTKLKLEFPDHASSTITTELAHLNFVLAKILHDRTRGSQIWRDSPYGLEEPTKQAPHAERATQLFMAVDSSRWPSSKLGSPDALIQSRMERLRGRQLIWDLYVHKERHPGQISDTYFGPISDKYDEAIGAFRKSLQLLSQSVYTLQPTRRDEIDCHTELGYCYINAVTFKDPNLKKCDNAAQGLKVYRDCHLNTAIEHFQEALDLATTCGDDKQLRIITGLGDAHFEKAIQLYDRLQEFLFLIPKFLDDLHEALQSNNSKIRVQQERKCASPHHLHLHSLTLEPGGVCYAVDQGFNQSKLNREWTKAVQMSRLIQSGARRVDLQWLIDQFVLTFVEGK